MGDYITLENSDNRLKVTFPVPPKYDLILQKEGRIKIKQIMAIDIEDAIAKGKLERPDLRGIVYSDHNEVSSI